MKVIKLLEKDQNFLGNPVVIRLAFIILVILILVIGCASAWLIEEGSLRAAMQYVVQINITVVIGISAIIIALKDFKNKKAIIRDCIFIIMLSLLCLFISFIPFDNSFFAGSYIHKVYFTLCNLLVTVLITDVGKQLFLFKDSQKTMNKKSQKKHRKRIS